MNKNIINWTNLFPKVISYDVLIDTFHKFNILNSVSNILFNKKTLDTYSKTSD